MVKKKTINSFYCCNGTLNFVLDEPLVWIDPKNYNEIKDLLKMKFLKKEQQLYFLPMMLILPMNLLTIFILLKMGKLLEKAIKRSI